MKRLVVVFFSVVIVLLLWSVNTASAAGTFCADLFELRRADGSVAANVGAVADMGQIKGYVDDGATVIHAQGWYLPESAMEDIGYQHDNGDITWGTAFVDPNIYGPLKSELPLRYNFDAPILEGRMIPSLPNGPTSTPAATAPASASGSNSPDSMPLRPSPLPKASTLYVLRSTGLPDRTKISPRLMRC